MTTPKFAAPCRTYAAPIGATQQSLVLQTEIDVAAPTAPLTLRPRARTHAYAGGTVIGAKGATASQMSKRPKG